MALNSSPYGGTTSLPQYLQKRQPQPQQQQNTQMRPVAGPMVPQKTQPAGPTPPPATQQPMSPGANRGLQNPTANNGMIGGMTTPAQSPGMVGSQPIPPAPPPPAPPVGMQPGGQTQTRTGAQQGAPPQSPATPASDSFGLPELIKRMLGGEGRYDNETIEGMRTASQQRLEDERRMSEDRLTANAASRGLLRSSGLNTSLGDTEERYLRGMMQSEADINRQVADARQQDLLSAINAAFGFGQGELDQQRLNWDALMTLGQMGMQGGPTIPGAAAGFDALPAPGLPESGGGWYEWLMSQFPKQGATA